MRRTEVVGPQVGAELTEQGGLAMLFTFIGILIYVGFRFEKKMAAGTVLAAMHDPIVILGFFAGDADHVRPRGAGGGAGGDRLLDQRHGRGVRPRARSISRDAQGDADAKCSTPRSTRRCRAR